MKFVHISDLHFNPMGDGRTSRSIRDGLVPYLKRQNIFADELLITGDYRHAKFQKKNKKILMLSSNTLKILQKQ